MALTHPKCSNCVALCLDCCPCCPCISANIRSISAKGSRPPKNCQPNGFGYTRWMNETRILDVWKSYEILHSEKKKTCLFKMSLWRTVVNCGEQYMVLLHGSCAESTRVAQFACSKILKAELISPQVLHTEYASAATSSPLSEFQVRAEVRM